MIKTRKFLIVCHGRLAGGLKSTLELIVGYVELVQMLEAYEEANKSIEKTWLSYSRRSVPSG